MAKRIYTVMQVYLLAAIFLCLPSELRATIKLSVPVYPSTHLAHLDILHCMDMLDILEQNAYAEEAIWNQKSLILS